MASTLLMMVLALGGSAVGQPNAVILLTPAEITWGTRPDGGKISVIEGNLRYHFLIQSFRGGHDSRDPKAK